MTVRLAIWLGRAQVDGVNDHTLRHRSRAWHNHEISIDKHPHTGRVLRTVRHAFAANLLGHWELASEAMLDGFEANGRSRPTPTTGPAAWCWPLERDHWLLSEPVNLLRCEE